MESSAPHGSAPPERSVEGTRESYQETSHSSRQGRCVESFDDQVDVVGLNGELHDAKPRPRRSGEGSTQEEEWSLLAQARQMAGASKRDVNGMARTMSRARAVAAGVPLPVLRAALIEGQPELFHGAMYSYHSETLLTTAAPTFV